MATLEDKLISSFILFEERINVDEELHKVRTKAIKNFEEKGFPTKKEEAWKYTSLNSILKNDFSVFPKNETFVDISEVKQFFIDETDTYKIVFVNGIFNSFLSSTTHDKIDVCLFSSALSKPKYRPIIDKYFNQIAPIKEPLTSLNTAFACEGAFIYIPENKIADKPIEIIYFSTKNEPNLWLNPRNLIVAKENAQVQIIERHRNLDNEIGVTNSVTEIYAEKNAVVDYYKIQNDTSKANLIDNTYISQQEKSTASVHTFSFGGNLIRNNLNFYHFGQYIESNLRGVTIIKEKQHVDHYTLVHHSQPNCESHQDYKGIFSDSSTGVFNGKIFVDKIAQKTNAFQQNNNVLMSPKATVNAKPQLEIFADDVKCSHGCTVGQLDNSALFYMQQRGIPQKEAKALLMFAFTNEIITTIKIPTLQRRITKLIARKLGVDLGFYL